ncbi:MATE family efflux transporter [Hellea balneolensis]|uniref:MATE family efflux transporter n=1 Tax=Hellea balneolensis TaxID=287478 RepID=UPI00041FA188|nr:MATE family efflux transporter [Hellea balneolensis]
MMGPFSLAVLALISTGIVDTIYLGRLTDPTRPNLAILALAALTFAFPLTFIGNSANIGLGAGTMSAVSRALGQGDTERARRHGAAAILMALTVMSVLVTLMLLIAPSILRFAGASEQVREMAISYLSISLPGLVIVSVASMSNNILRASGEAALPSSIMILAAIINIILDPFFIFGWGPFPRLELQGAAVATLIGNIVGASFGFYLVMFHRKAISFAEMTIGSMRRAWSIIGQVGIPAAGTNIIVPVATFAAVAILGLRLSEVEIAAFGVASRAELISIGVIYGLSACIGAITGRNGGAGKTERVRETFRICFWICFIWCSFMAIIMAVFSQQIAQIFTNDPLLIEKIVPYFYIVPVTLFGYGFVFIAAAGLNAIGRPMFGLTYTIIRSLVLYVGFIFIGVQIAGLTGAYYGVAAANIISGVIALFWTLKRAPMTAKKS